MESFLADVNNSMNSALSFMDDPVVNALVSTLLVLYACLAAPELPDNVATLFKNPFFRFAMLFTLSFTISRNAMLSIVVSFVILALVDLMHKMHSYQMESTQDKPNLIEMQRVVSVPEKNVPMNNGVEFAENDCGCGEVTEHTDNVVHGLDTGCMATKPLAAGQPLAPVQTESVIGNNHENIPPAFKRQSRMPEPGSPSAMDSAFQNNSCVRGPHCDVFNDVQLLGPEMGMRPMAPVGVESNSISGVMPF